MGLQSPQDSPSTNGVPCKITHVVADRIQLLIGCHPESSDLCYMNFSIAAHRERERSQEEARRFYNLILKVPHRHSCHILIDHINQSRYNVEESYVVWILGVNTRKQGHLEGWQLQPPWGLPGPHSPSPAMSLSFPSLSSSPSSSVKAVNSLS